MLSPAMLPLLETFMKILCPNTFSLIITFFWVSLMSHNPYPFKMDFNIEKSQQPLRGWIHSIARVFSSTTDLLPWIAGQMAFCELECDHDGGTSCWVTIQTFFCAEFQIISLIFLHSEPGWLFGLVSTNKILHFLWKTSSVPSTCFWLTLNPSKKLHFFMTSVPYASDSFVHVSLALFLISHKI